MPNPWYATREDVMSALDYAETARNARQIDRALEAGARAVERLLHRRLYPWTGTRFFDWPGDAPALPWRLWFHQHDLASLTTLVAGGVTIPAGGYNLEPVNSGPPYTYLEMRLDTSYALAAGATWQHAIALTGVWGYTLDEDTTSTLAAAISTTTATTLTVTDSSGIGVGSILRVDSERMLVTGRTMASTSQTLQTPLASSAAAVSVAVTDGTQYHVDEVLLLDSERMRIVDIAANTLTVKRAWDGSVLAAHTGSTIYALRGATITRGALGTTAATHSQGATVGRWLPPGPAQTLNVAEAIVTLNAQQAGYSRTASRGDLGKATVPSLDDVRDTAWTALGRKHRQRAV